MSLGWFRQHFMRIVFKKDEFGELLKHEDIHGSTTYSWLLFHHREWNDNDNWYWIWKLSVLAKVQHFFCLCMQNAISANKLFGITTTWQLSDLSEFLNPLWRCASLHYGLCSIEGSLTTYNIITSVNHSHFSRFTTLKTHLSKKKNNLKTWL